MRVLSSRTKTSVSPFSVCAEMYATNIYVHCVSE